jgi:hypothetical protein
VEVERPESRPALPNPQPIETQTFKWDVLVLVPGGDGNIQVQRSPQITRPQPYYAITPQEYEILSRNMAEMLRWIKEAHWRLQYYRGDGGLDGNEVPTEEK